MRVPRFDYPLAPLLQQAAWQLDAARAELAAGLRRLESITAAAAAHAQHVSALHDWIKPTSPMSLDPALARNRVAYLSHAAEKAASFERDARSAEEEIAVLQNRCREKQLRLDAIERHREECEHSHRFELDRKASVQSDGDWLVRQHWTESRTNAVCAKEQAP